MEGAGVEKCRRGRAEAAALVEIVEADDPLLAVFDFRFEQAHGDAHPEELGCLEAAWFVAGLVDDEVAIIHRLHAEIVEIEVGAGVERIGEDVDVEGVEQIGMDALDSDAVGEVAAEGIAVRGFDASDAIAQDVPAENFFVDVGEEDATSELREVGIFFDHRAGIEDDGLLEVIGGNFRADGATQLALDFVFCEAEIEADGGEGDAFFQVGTVPEGGLAFFIGDDDHRLLIDVLDDFLVVAAVAGALETIAHVGAHRLKITGAAELFLDHVLHVLDVDKGLLAGAHAVGHGLGDIERWLGIFADGKEGLAHGDFDFRFRPRHDVAIAADEADGHGLWGGVHIDVATALERTAECEGLCDIVGVVFHEGFFDEQIEIIFRETQATAFLDVFRERLRDRVGHGGNERAVRIAEDRVLFGLAGDEQVGESAADGVGDLGEGELRFGRTGGDGDFGMGAVEVLAQHFTPGKLGIGDGGTVGDDFFQGEVFF